MPRVSNTGKACSLHKSHKEAIIEREYDKAVQALRYLQMFDGALFLGQDPFELEIKIVGKSSADGSNVYKGIEDGLNQVAWFDDKQNVYFRKEFCKCENNQKD